ncbi:hypothetical protein CTA2_3226, partial [Colletotrichum tanaceti]
VGGQVLAPTVSLFSPLPFTGTLDIITAFFIWINTTSGPRLDPSHGRARTVEDSVCLAWLRRSTADSFFRAPWNPGKHEKGERKEKRKFQSLDGPKASTTLFLVSWCRLNLGTSTYLHSRRL